MTKNDDVKGPEKSDNKSDETLTEKGLENEKSEEDENSPAVGSEQTTGEDLRANDKDKQPNEHNDGEKKDQVKDDISEEREKVETEEEKEENQKEEEAEIELSPAQYLALLRETELLLYQATLNHEKVSEQILSAYKKIMHVLKRGRIVQLGSLCRFDIKYFSQHARF